ncbi:MAG: aminoglycoside phosphotransferase [Schwartzia sp.]|nr:aminoglycoside phosphotransferase [Schwartzia sp. (in: firmicutes)]
MDAKTREKIRRSVEELKKRMAVDSNDLDYETHLHTVRTLQGILEKDAERARERGGT